ncbi:Protein FAR1-RELATED SEQUENCE 5 [Abeliophyllum distichum]|uniref:Protein FAR1-RELATED SEQUENCE 5 n=1 Tax=Abeliophyllum distichum TaxID=126358 RepID=A0ABD1V1R3_9LAMI
METESSNNVFVPQVTICRIPKEEKTDETYHKKEKDAVPRVGERNRGNTRCGCNAKLSVLKHETRNLWVVNKFVVEHNHALTTPSKVHLLRSHRNVSATKKALAHQFSEANIPTCQQLRIMEIDAGSLDSVGYVERYLMNHERNIQEELKGHDVETLIEYFSFEKEKSPNFYFDYDTDLDNKLVHYFWADSESCRSYAFFRDAAVFVTTYNTNKYSMIFAPFEGVNHHGQTVLFGCGLLSDESTESFVWLLSKFMDAMPRDAPQIIITDQDAAIVKAISMVWPLTFHSFLFLKKKQVLLLPDKYILRRWTKNAKFVAVEYPSASISDGGSCSSSLFSRYGMLAHKSSLLVDDASLTDARTSLLMEEFATLHLRIKAIDDGGNIGLSRNRNKNTEERITIHDPSFVRAKGCRKRLKSSKDKSMAKNIRRCSAFPPEGEEAGAARIEGVSLLAAVSENRCEISANGGKFTKGLPEVDNGNGGKIATAMEEEQRRWQWWWTWSDLEQVALGAAVGRITPAPGGRRTGLLSYIARSVQFE